ncbi:unnamed protein product [Mycena citricolor]|uniref:F-box domain-containing protein n=1 Tax=Mycena citricolor TaxID=2018698 RepID=A0AAD2HZV8_9AGAR|nr:unnamed protein product [Mycena citricolor]
MNTRELRKRISALDRSISILQDQLHLLEAEKADLATQLCRSTYPVESLPPEIIVHIFVDYIAALDKPTLFPAFLGVCRTWRQIALGTAGLWNDIVIPWQHPQPDVLLQRWVERAGPRIPLDIYMGLETTEPVLAVLGAHASRWRRLVLRMSMRSTLAVAPGDGSGSWECLEELDVLADLQHAAVLSPVTGLFSAPRLRRVCVHSFPATQFVLPWTQITSLALLNQSLAQCLMIISQTRQLEALHVSLTNRNTSHHPISLVLPALRRFKIERDAVPPILGYMTLPLLTDLDVSGHVDGVISLVMRSGCTITHLRLSHMLMDEDPVYACLRALPGVTHLVVASPRTEDLADFLWTLADASYHTQDPPVILLPMLQSFVLKNCLDVLELESVVRLLETRCRQREGYALPTALLRTFRATWGEDVDEDEGFKDPIPVIKQLVREGLSLQLDMPQYWQSQELNWHMVSVGLSSLRVSCLQIQELKRLD